MRRRPAIRTLHQLRRSRLTHLAEAGVAGPLLMAKSRHGSVKTLNLYAKPSFDAVAEVTARLDPAVSSLTVASTSESSTSSPRRAQAWRTTA